MHHPPMLTLVSQWDRLGLPPSDRAGLADVLRHSPQHRRALSPDDCGSIRGSASRHCPEHVRPGSARARFRGGDHQLCPRGCGDSNPCTARRRTGHARATHRPRVSRAAHWQLS
jgi:hypothetical protein